MSPLASFVIPTRNRRELLIATLGSLLAQTEPRWEAIVVDDGSIDGTPGYVAGMAREDPRFRLLHNPPPRTGACAARNIGAAASVAPYVIFLDSDDLLEPHAIARRVEAMQARPDMDFLVSAARCFVDEPGDTAWLWNVDEPEATPQRDLDRFLGRDIPWQTTGPTWRRQALIRVGGWDEAAPSGQDLDFHVRALVAGLSYERLDGYDFHWRMGRPGRASIGARAIQADHWRYRAKLAERFLHLLQERDLLNDHRRILLAGEFWAAADNLRQRGGVRGATRVWDRARLLGLISRRRWLEGLAYLVGYGRRQVRKPILRYLRAAWPPGLLHEPSPTHTRAPIPPAWSDPALSQQSGDAHRGRNTGAPAKVGMS